MKYLEEKRAVIQIWNMSTNSLMNSKIFQNPQKSFAYIEGLILFYGITNLVLMEEIPDEAHEFREDLIPYVYKVAKDDNIENRMPSRFHMYIRNMSFNYTEEIEMGEEDKNYLMPILVHNLLFEPLKGIERKEDTFLHKENFDKNNSAILLLPSLIRTIVPEHKNAIKSIVQNIE